MALNRALALARYAKVLAGCATYKQSERQRPSCFCDESEAKQHQSRGNNIKLFVTLLAALFSTLGLADDHQPNIK